MKLCEIVRFITFQDIIRYTVQYRTFYEATKYPSLVHSEAVLLIAGWEPGEGDGKGGLYHGHDASVTLGFRKRHVDTIVLENILFIDFF